MNARICVTRPWKRARSGGSAATRAASPGRLLFQGTIYLAQLEFAGPGGPWSVSPADLATVLAYLTKAAPVIADYAGQYGPTALSIGGRLPPRTVPVATASYTDAQLQGWVNAMASASSLGPDSAILVLNPPGVVNQNAKESGGIGVIGYHGLASVPYSFVNLLGSGFALDDHSDQFAEAVSHEIAEMTVDPQADDSNPEVCDGCGGNCLGPSAIRNYFDGQGDYLGSSASFPPAFAYAFFLSAIAKPPVASDCPVPESGCAYPPPTS